MCIAKYVASPSLTPRPMQGGRITSPHYPSARLERDSWRPFQQEAFGAFERHVVPLLGGLEPPVEIELVQRGAWVTTDPDLSSTATYACDRLEVGIQGPTMQPVTTL